MIDLSITISIATRLDKQEEACSAIKPKRVCSRKTDVVSQIAQSIGQA